MAAPALLVTLPPWHRVFLRNLADLLWPQRQKPLTLSSRPGSFWPDVFVASRLPWGRFLESAIFHTAVVVSLWSAARLWPQRPQIVDPAVFHSSDVIYYEADDLPPLDTGATEVPSPQKGEPEHAAQTIISVPPEADNRRQTIVTPPKLKLNTDVPLPNIVAWSHTQPTIPPAAVVSSRSDLKLPVLPASVVAPPPEVSRSRLDPPPALVESVVAPAPGIEAVTSRSPVYAPQPAVVEPAPNVDPPSTRRLSDISIGHSQVIAPAPQLPVSEQRALPPVPGNTSAAVVQPPPSVQGVGNSNSDGRLIALGIHPVAPGGPVDVPPGNRRGTFAATPEGKSSAPGTPDIPSRNNSAALHAAGQGTANTVGSGKNTNGIPPGLLVGASPKTESASSVAGTQTNGSTKAASDNSRLMASVTSARVTIPPRAASEVPAGAATELERKVFGGRKSYAMTLNTPNLNSASGSWVIHFAELKENADSKNSEAKANDLVFPVATQEVDPGYPIELMRENVQGTVTLSAVIQSDGSVGDVKILSGVDDRLDQYACAALSRWRFRPATKNGNPVALRAVVRIPFRPTPRKSGF